MNSVILTGRVVKDAEMHTTETGKKFCVVSFAIREDRKPETVETTFVDLLLWEKRAEALAKYLTKGKFILVTGRLSIRKTKTDDKTYVNPAVIVDELEFLEKKDKTIDF